MSARVAIVVFPGTNSEDETLRACRAVGCAAELVASRAGRDALRGYDAYVLPGGFAYEDRVRAGAIAAHDGAMAAIREAAGLGKPVLGICNGAQILLESGLVPDLAGDGRPQAAFARNAPSGRYRSVAVHVRLAIPPDRCAIARTLAAETVLPAWASHGEGRLAASSAVLDELAGAGRVAFRYCDARGNATAAAIPNGSALGAAGLVNARGNVLAFMPHPERAAWNFMRDATRGTSPLEPSGGIALFAGLRAAAEAAR